uniref:Uncharacterized protein n=1 Tax=Arundo donax TaxID=35708 RepID=A0A0A8Y7K6_ARUDO
MFFVVLIVSDCTAPKAAWTINRTKL